MCGHEYPTAPFGFPDENLRGSAVQSQWLFDEHVLAGSESRRDSGGMLIRREANVYCVYRGISQGFFEGFAAANSGKIVTGISRGKVTSGFGEIARPFGRIRVYDRAHGDGRNRLPGL
jgi:hypothetical protein